MIIGKSLTALGGGGLKPEISVTAKAGALLNLHYKDSSIILQSYQLGEAETTHTFVVSVSETAYVVEDVTNSASVEVLVDSVAVFDVKISYFNGILFDNGDECEEFTGGLYFEKANGDSTPSMTNTGSYLEIKTPVSSDGNIKTNKVVPLSGYTKINFKYTYSTGSSSISRFHVWGTNIIYKSSVNLASPASCSFSRESTSTLGYVANFGSGYLRIYKIWLE